MKTKLNRNVGVWTIMATLTAIVVSSCGGRVRSDPETVASTAAAYTVSPPTIGTATHATTGRLDQMSLGCTGSAPSTTLGTPIAHTDALSMPLVSFDGTAEATGCQSSGATSDDSGVIGPRHYVQTTNDAVAVYDRTGRLLAGPVLTATLFNGLSGCGGSWTDASVLYDRYADRWVITRFSMVGNQTGPSVQCFVVSQTSDPLGTYDLYQFPVSSIFADYPKLGVWPDGYYMTDNEYPNPPAAHVRSANRVSIFERSQMLAGAASPRIVTFTVSTSGTPHSHLMPSYADGPTLPPSGSPNFLIQVQDDEFGFPADALQVWQASVNWTTPTSSTLTATTYLANDLRTDVCNTGGNPGFGQSCLSQPGTANQIDTMDDDIMYRLAYRNFGSYEDLVVNFTVAMSTTVDRAAPRWYELRRSGGGAWSIFQEGTHAPDTTNRWLGSIAMDKSGNIALGYVANSGSVYPSARYAGRLASDPTGTFPEVERSLAEGLGSLLGNGQFGDYSELSVDPTDDCTFWMTNTYVPATSATNDWHTRIGSFRFNTCDQPEPPPTGNVAAARQSSNVTAVFAVGSDGALYDRSITASGTTWSAPQALTPTGSAPAGAAVATGLQTATQLDVFYVGIDQKVHYVWESNDGAWQPNTALPGQPASFAPAGAHLATATQGGQLGVAVVDNSGKLEILWWNPLTGWLGPVAITGAGYAPAGASVSVGTRSDGELDAFSIGSDGALKYMAFNGGIWSGPFVLSVGSFAPPGGVVASATDTHGFLNVVTVANDGALYTKWDCTALWCGPTALTATGFAPKGGAVSAVNFQNLVLDLFLVPNTGDVNSLSNSGSSWQGPISLTAQGAAAPGAATAAATQGTANLDLVAVGNPGLYEFSSPSSPPLFLP